MNNHPSLHPKSLFIALTLGASTLSSNAQGVPFPPAPTEITPALAEVPAGLPAGAQLENGNFDQVSWLTFIALNWPAKKGSCEPDLTKSILSGDGPVVWESYLSDSDVFVAPGSKPAKWCSIPPGSTGLKKEALDLAKEHNTPRFFPKTSKINPSIQEIHGIEEVGGPLTDKNGRFVRYEVRLNQDEYNYITKNNLWNKQGQEGKKIKFPQGKSEYGPVGAMEIKAAWKVIGEGDDPSRFYTIQAIVYNDENGTPSPGKTPVTLGLVGLHILHKTTSQQDWLWSTFEQVDNKKSFSYPEGKENIQTAKSPYKELNPDGTPVNKPVNVVRINPIENPATEKNKAFRKLLAGSVWENYTLIASQWSGNLGNQPKPAFLANTVIETYTQGPHPASDGPIPYGQKGYNPFAMNKAGTTTLASSSCIKCHSVAKTAVKTDGDFSFLLGNAQ